MVAADLVPDFFSLQARILYSQRKPKEALFEFQSILKVAPRSKPDPRIGIGMCFWVLGSKHQASAAWRRSLEIVCLPRTTSYSAPLLIAPPLASQDPSNWQAETLLGLEQLNLAKDQRRSSDERPDAVVSGFELLMGAFAHSGKKSAAAASALASQFALEQSNYTLVRHPARFLASCMMSLADRLPL